MKILVVGSPQRDEDEDYWTEFISACEHLGVALAQAEHTTLWAHATKELLIAMSFEGRAG